MILADRKTSMCLSFVLSDWCVCLCDTWLDLGGTWPLHTCCNVSRKNCVIASLSRLWEMSNVYLGLAISAAAVALSFPLIFLCEGTHWRVTSHPCVVRLMRASCIPCTTFVDVNWWRERRGCSDERESIYMEEEEEKEEPPRFPSILPAVLGWVRVSRSLSRLTVHGGTLVK